MALPVNEKILGEMREYLYSIRPNTVTYKHLGTRFGIAYDPAGPLRFYLEALSDSFEKHGFLISALVVQKESGGPGQGFYNLCDTLGISGRNDKRWVEQLNKIAAYKGGSK